MDRQQIIAAIDAEIARLEHARLLITQSRLTEQKSLPALACRKQARERNERTLVRKVETPSLPQPVRQIAERQEKEVSVVRVPAREARKSRRIVPAARRQMTALTNDVPRTPVVVPPKPPEKTERLQRAMPPPASTTAPASAFGIAISRGLA